MLRDIWSTELADDYRFNGRDVLTRHPFVSGWPSRIALLEQMIQHISGFKGVWWVTLEEVAACCASPGASEIWTPPDLIPLSRDVDRTVKPR